MESILDNWQINRMPEQRRIPNANKMGIRAAQEGSMPANFELNPTLYAMEPPISAG